MTTQRKKHAPDRVEYIDGIPFCPECGLILSSKRSFRHLGLLFVFLAYLFKHWDGLIAGRKLRADFEKEDIDDFEPISTEHLRAWIFVQSGAIAPYTPMPFRTKLEREISLQSLNWYMNFARAQGRYGWPREVEGGIAVLEPISIAVYGDTKMTEAAFCDVTRGVFNFVYEKLGVDIQEWKETYNKRKDYDG